MSLQKPTCIICEKPIEDGEARSNWTALVNNDFKYASGMAHLRCKVILSLDEIMKEMKAIDHISKRLEEILGWLEKTK